MSEGTPDAPQGMPDVPVPQRYDADWRVAVARRWAARLSTASDIPLAREVVEQTLLELVDRAIGALDDPSTVDEVGRAEALLRSKLKADRELAASEARFGEVFTTTPIGVDLRHRGEVHPGQPGVRGRHGLPGAGPGVDDDPRPVPL